MKRKIPIPQNRIILLAFIIVLCQGISACNIQAFSSQDENVSGSQLQDAQVDLQQDTPIDTVIIENGTASFVASAAPQEEGQTYVELNDGIPCFLQEDMTTTSFETYSDLDELGRCGVAYANVGQDIMPTEERGEIGMIKPTGWHTVKYQGVDGNYLYNRCHLLAYQLTGENANEKNLITGTRYFNVEGMLPFEEQVGDYVRKTGNHVLYRVTPIYEDDNLVASGVTMEAFSVEDNGKGVCFYVYVYNVQPGIEIDYLTGESRQKKNGENSNNTNSKPQEYVLNTSSKKFHNPDCSGSKDIKEKNKQEVKRTREEIMGMGYEPCGMCNP